MIVTYLADAASDPNNTQLAAVVASVGYAATVSALVIGSAAPDTSRVPITNTRPDWALDDYDEELDGGLPRLRRQHARSARVLTLLSDLMLVLMVAGVVGAAVCAIAGLYLVTPVVLGVTPTAYVASRRLTSASKQREESLHNAQINQIEREKQHYEAEAIRLKNKQESKLLELEVHKRRIEIDILHDQNIEARARALAAIDRSASSQKLVSADGEPLGATTDTVGDD